MKKSQDEHKPEANSLKDSAANSNVHPDWEGFERQQQSTVQNSNMSGSYVQVNEIPIGSAKKKAKSVDRKDSRPLPKLQLFTTKKHNDTVFTHRMKESDNLARHLAEPIRVREKPRQLDISLPAALTSSSCTSTKNTKQQQQIRYPRVPIVRFDENLAISGLLVYRGMEPRTSDRYFITLEDVDYMSPIGVGHGNDRLKEPLTFNSKFQS